MSVLKSAAYPYNTKHSKDFLVKDFGLHFHFNGKEKDDEVKGQRNSYDFGERMYDPRLGRMPSIDPFAKQFPTESNYSYAGNCPIALVDHKGQKKIYYIHVIELDGSQTTLKVVDNSIVKTKVTYTRENIGVGNMNLYTTQVSNKETFDLSQHITIDKKTGTIIYGEEKEGRQRSNSSLVRAYEDNFKDEEKKGNYDGIAWIGETGQGEETKKGTGTRVESIDELQGLLNTTKSAAKGSEYLLKTISKISDVIEKIGESQTLVEATDPIGKKIPNVGGKPSKPDSTYCGTCDKNIVNSDTTGHNLRPEEK